MSKFGLEDEVLFRERVHTFERSRGWINQDQNPRELEGTVCVQFTRGDGIQAFDDSLRICSSNQ